MLSYFRRRTADTTRQLPSAQGLVEANRAYGGLANVWTSPNTWILDKLRETVSSVKRLTFADVEDIIQDILSGLSLKSKPGGVLYDIGSSFTATDLRKAEIAGKAAHYLARHAYHRAISLQKNMAVRENQSHPMDVTPPLDRQEITHILMDDPEIRTWFYELCQKEWQKSPSKLRILNMWLSNPEATYTDIAVMLNLNANQYSGKSDPSYVRKVIGEAMQLAIANLDRVPSSIHRKIDLINVSRGKVAQSLVRA
jgi:hypothetical protein